MKIKLVLVLVLLGCSFSIPQAFSADSTGKTKYPIVLVHGLSGFDSILADYFYGVKGALRGVGANAVYTPQVTGYESNAARGEELLAYVQQLLAVTGAAKVNLIGHSQGGPTARYVASVRPDLVASVTSVGSPHFGSPVADLIKDSPLEGPTLAIGNAVGVLLAALSGDTSQQQNAMGSLESLNTQGAKAFNAIHPQGLRTGSCKTTPTYNAGSWWWPNYVKNYSVNDGAHQVNGVRYYSWSGIYTPLFDSNVLDLADGLLSVTWLAIGESNDGLVGRCSSHMGKVIRDDYTLNHADEINGMFGLRGLWSSNPVQIYVEHARRLKAAGL
ncbi:triacylglycerol lipase [Simiduia curdlanivorans]|uniref:Lipase family alpha/beta hydrolase n=1 Tax=Simiduia curdlanivorans TaxID=1492769 RepID=A0ABV8V524_9GAMM|nr:triacylglycerol lipase [Simiduia curdlanivorans]MDN3640923.1 triacylglycerol lipase [Simiduia curdlanivorans]